MHDPLTFESRLSDSFDRYLAAAPVGIDARAMAAVAGATRPARARRGAEASVAARLALAGVVLGALVVGLTVAGHLLDGNVVGPAHSGAPLTSAPTASGESAAPSPTDRTPVAAPPVRTWGAWVADVATSVPGVTQTPGRLQLLVDGQEAMTFSVQLPDGTRILLSRSIAASSGEIQMRGGGAQCGAAPYDKVGRYRWSRSSDGLFMTLDLIEDQCGTRAAILARTWVHSLEGAINDGGPTLLAGITPMVQLELPTGLEYSAYGARQAASVLSSGNSDSFRAFSVIRNPDGQAACGPTDEPSRAPIGHTTDAFVAYVKGQHGATVTTSTTMVGGRPAVELEVSGLPYGCLITFYPEDLSDDPSISVFQTEAKSMYVVQVDATTTFLLWFEGATPEKRGVLDSIKFIDTLPTP
ncbi:MAG: hypothetical protein ABI620_03880 [Chloroflexota bacterium]